MKNLRKELTGATDVAATGVTTSFPAAKICCCLVISWASSASSRALFIALDSISVILAWTVFRAYVETRNALQAHQISNKFHVPVAWASLAPQFAPFAR